jgi:2'-5' RNA ligase
VWAGTEPSAEVDALFRTLETVCGSFGFLRETRKFHPHITIGRVKGTRNLARLTEATKSVTFEPISTECREIRLMKSVLGPEGSAYSILTTVSLLS